MTRQPNVSGRFRKAIATFYAAFTMAGGTTFLEDWHQTGKVAGAAIRGLVVGLITATGTAAVTAYIPNDPPNVQGDLQSAPRNSRETPQSFTSEPEVQDRPTGLDPKESS